MGDELRSILERLKQTPHDVALRTSAAEALEKATRPGAARTAIDEVLAGFINLTGHDDDTGLPCLCRTCLAEAPPTAEASGMRFYRSFVIAGTRVLHFWLVDDVAQRRARVRQSVGTALIRRLTMKDDKKR